MVVGNDIGETVVPGGRLDVCQVVPLFDMGRTFSIGGITVLINIHG